MRNKQEKLKSHEINKKNAFFQFLSILIYFIWN